MKIDVEVLAQEGSFTLLVAGTTLALLVSFFCSLYGSGPVEYLEFTVRRIRHVPGQCIHIACLVTKI